MARCNAPDVSVPDLDNFEVRNVDFYASIQERLRRVGEEFSTFAQAWWGKEAANFLDGTPGDDRMDDTWRPIRILGKGAFGLVGLWQKFNKNDEVEDAMAIKEMGCPPLYQYHYYVKGKPGLSREAAIMKQVNEAEKSHFGRYKNIVRLRNFKHFPAPNKWRFYLEYAPYGDLWKLTYLYRSWNAYFPEEFLWHVFHNLAKAAVVMDEGPFTDLETGEQVNRSITHYDIKPDNIYMGKSEATATFTNYPVVKLADFGLAMLTGKDDKDNPRLHRYIGTPDYRPPEHRNFTVHWQKRPDGFQHQESYPKSLQECDVAEKDMNDPGYQYLSAHNIWGFGKVMHDMMKLDYGDQVDGIMDREISERNYYEKYNEHGIPPITTKKVPEYSSSLRDLIRECLHIKIGKRPSPRALLDRTGRGLQAAAESIRTNPHDFNGPRVYYMGHEINHMPAGNAMRAMRQEDFECIEQDMWPDPTWQPLLAARWAPQVINRELVNEPIVEGGPKREIPPLHATVRKDPRPLEDNPRGVRWALQWPSPRNSEQRDKQGGDEGANNQRGNERTNSQRWRDEMQYQEELGQQLRDSGTHDTLSLSPPPHKERPKSSMNNAPGQGEIPAMPEQEMEQATALLEQWLRETTGVPQSENGPTGQPNPPPKEGGTERQRTPMNNAPGQSEVTAMPEKGVEETAALLEQLVRETTGLPQLETVPSGTRMRSKASTRSADQQPQSEQVPSGPRTRSKGSPLPPEQQPRPENMTADQLNPLPEEGGREIPRTVENRASQQREEEGGATSLPQQENVPSGPQARSNGTTQPPNQQPQLEKVPSGPRTGSKRSTQPPAKQPQPENVPSGPQIEPTGSTQPPNQQPQPKKRKRRAMGLSIDESFQAAESRVVGGRNLRKRQK